MNVTSCNFFVIFLILLVYIVEKGECKKKTYTISYSSGVTLCPDEDSKNFIETSDLKAVRINETIAVLTGKFEFKKKIENNWKLVALLEKVLPNGAKEVVASHELSDFCKALKEKQSDTLHSQYFRATSLPNECPIEPAIYEIDNMIANTKHLSLNALLVGVYTITFTFSSYEKVGSGLLATTKDTFGGCLYFDCAVEPV